MRIANRIIFLLTMTGAVAAAQVSTGIPPFSSIGGGPFDQINLGNLNVHFAIPVIHKAGRGVPFNFDLTYDSSIWTPENVSGVTEWVPNTYWPNTNWGWSSTPLTIVGYLSSATTSQTQRLKCAGGFGSETTYTTTNFVYVDLHQGRHPFPGSTSYVTAGGGCGNGIIQYGSSVNAVSTDGSGLQMAYCYNPAQCTVEGSTVTNRLGVVLWNSASPYGGYVDDTNGNGIDVNPNTGQFFDTLSGTTPVLTQAGSATPTSPVTYTYTAPSGASAIYTVKYLQYTVATAFNISGVQEYGPTSVALVSSIVLPDQTRYTFSYEPTPGSCTPLANTYANNCVTGRLEEVTLPTGGSITYVYDGGPSNTGIYSDGSTAGFTRTLSPGGQWQYSRSLNSGTPGPGSAWTTTVADPNSNNTVLNFAEDMNTGNNATYNLYETQRSVYQGSNTLLATAIRCYNQNLTNCATASSVGFIQWMWIYSQLPNGKTRLSEFSYDSYGDLTDDREYDYGVTVGVDPVTAHLIRETSTAYAYVGSQEPVGLPSAVKVYDWTSGSQVLLSSTSYSYDQTSVTPTAGTPQHSSPLGLRGNLTTLTVQTNSSGSTLSSTYAYYDTGNLNTATDINGAITTYNYASGLASCYNSFPTSLTEPLNLTRSMTWNCTGGVQTSVKDENSQTVTTNYTDLDFWRPANVYDQENNETTIAYPSETATESALSFNSGQSVVDQRWTVDGFGRPILSQRLQGPGVTNYDTTETDYNVVGLASRTTMPFSASAGGTNSSAPGVVMFYDALGRPLSATDSDGGTTSYTYTNNDVLVTVSGSQSFSKQLEYDGLGRLASVCEISSSLPGVGTCGQSNAPTGYWTRYTYDALGHLLTVTQNAQASSGHQTRSYSYDMAGRLISETNPETGTTAYTYDSTCGSYSASAGDMTKRVDNAGNTTCYAYDALHRLTDAGYSGPICRHYRYDTSATPYNNGTPPSGVTVSNTMTRLKEASTDQCSFTTLQTDEWFSYSPRGELTDVYESTPHSGVYYHTTAAYWPSGTLETLNGIPSVPTINYGAGGGGLDGEGRYTQVTAGSGPNPVTGVTYSTNSTSNPLGALTGVTYGSSDSDAFTYDPNTGRAVTYTSKVNGVTDTGSLTWNTNGTLASLTINDSIPSTIDSQSCTSYTYDDLARASGVNCGAAGTQSFSYDPFGNISKTANGLGLTFQPSSYNASNQPVVSGMNFDAVGNTKTDNLGNTYAWDPNWGDMTSVNGITATYDAFGRMVEMSGSPIKQILYSPVGKTALMNGTALAKAFVGLPGGGTAVYEPSGLVYYRHADWLGSSRLASTPTRTLYSSTAYAPFGEPYDASGTADPSFTGQNSDTVPSLYDFTFRRLSPSQGRWISPDPAGLSSVDPTAPRTWNRYAYVANNPLGFIDELGLNLKGPGNTCVGDSDGIVCGGGLLDQGGDDPSGGGGGLGGFCDASNNCSGIAMPCDGGPSCVNGVEYAGGTIGFGQISIFNPPTGMPSGLQFGLPELGSGVKQYLKGLASITLYFLFGSQEFTDPQYEAFLESTAGLFPPYKELPGVDQPPSKQPLDLCKNFPTRACVHRPSQNSLPLQFLTTGNTATQFWDLIP